MHSYVQSLADLSNVYRGAVAEQFVGQELLAHGGSENNRLYYWKRAAKSSSAEVDFVVVRNGKIYPVEVKSGPKGRMKSLQILLDEHPEIEKGFVLSSSFPPNQPTDNMVFAPIYASIG